MIAISVPYRTDTNRSNGNDDRGKELQIIVEGILPGLDNLPEDPRVLFTFPIVVFAFLMGIANSMEVGLGLLIGSMLVFWVFPEILKMLGAFDDNENRE